MSIVGDDDPLLRKLDVESGFRLAFPASVGDDGDVSLEGKRARPDL